MILTKKSLFYRNQLKTAAINYIPWVFILSFLPGQMYNLTVWGIKIGEIHFEKNNHESIQITTFAARMAQKFKAKIHLVACHDKDSWIEHKIQSNQLVVRKHFASQNVEHEIINLPGIDSYEKELMVYSETVDADIIAAAYYKEGILPSPNSFIQVIIENDQQIPVLTVNSEELYVINSNYTFMTV